MAHRSRRPAQTGWGAPPVAQGNTQGGWAASAPLAPVAPAAAPEKDAVPEKEDDGVVVDPAVLEATFVFCLVWSLGASVIQKHGFSDRDRVDSDDEKAQTLARRVGWGPNLSFTSIGIADSKRPLSVGERG